MRSKPTGRRSICGGGGGEGGLVRAITRSYCIESICCDLFTLYVLFGNQVNLITSTDRANTNRIDKHTEQHSPILPSTKSLFGKTTNIKKGNSYGTIIHGIVLNKKLYQHAVHIQTWSLHKL